MPPLSIMEVAACMRSCRRRQAGRTGRSGERASGSPNPIRPSGRAADSLWGKSPSSTPVNGGTSLDLRVRWDLSLAFLRHI
ncbi:hypothetical protein GUJ93_ZPchr0004g39255 [Zizania palustris]|uniref:Uncharacterized protein n=1 Tax=Zizania palustris TaxID=103762 RepID=A0A8J5T3U4_ZIZPA|nr:hypothetical protein GUJ93_ZPchr0004g39255 [Zizania palustris]